MYYHTNQYTKDNKKNKYMKVLVFAFIIVSILAVMMISVYSKDGQAVRYKTVIVKNGDTLWHIARRNYDQNQDPRKLIETIKKINNLKTLIIQPGDKIKIPS